MVHYLETGHFELEDGHIRFVRTDEPGRPFKQVVARPMDSAALEAALREIGGDHLTLSTIPRDWQVSLRADGVLVSNEYTHSRDAVEFVARVAELTGAEIWADGGQRRLDPRQVVRDWVTRRERVLRARNKRDAD